MKQDSYCCAPIDTTDSNLPDPSLSAYPMRKMPSELPTIPTVPPSNPYAGMSQTFPGGPIAPGMGPVAIPDPIPGVQPEKENRFQCCSSSPMLTILKRPESPSMPSSLVNQASSTDMPTASPLPVECPPGFFLIEDKCLKVLFAGQKGCLSDEQCATREPNATCDSGYCVCPATKPLVHGGKCVAGCPEGFANIAGRMSLNTNVTDLILEVLTATSSDKSLEM
ncbi:EB module [Teladorsagia circumcincta]|uniref:EB module n=1 Tax=Teladorsagia circumcincta TaxID=45464 RepID=A0A2G9U791_TELCI|nr:EB module [Teladorsagia circumcincta]